MLQENEYRLDLNRQFPYPVWMAELVYCHSLCDRGRLPSKLVYLARRLFLALPDDLVALILLKYTKFI